VGSPRFATGGRGTSLGAARSPSAAGRGRVGTADGLDTVGAPFPPDGGQEIESVHSGEILNFRDEG